MEDIILLLYVQDAEYGKRLLRFLAGKKNPRLHLELATERQSVEYRVGSEWQELVILTDTEEIKEEEKKKRKVLYLANWQDRESGKIFQFQKAEEIYKELLWQLKLEPKNTIPVNELTETPVGGIYLVMSPCGSGTTVLSAMLAQYLANRGKCLYLCMSGFPVFYKGELSSDWNVGGESMSELLFSLGDHYFLEKEARMRQAFGRAWMLPPLSHFKDILDCDEKDWEEFLRQLREVCGYDSIVIEMGLLYEHILDIMAVSDFVFFLKDNGMQGRIRCETYEYYCRLEKKNSLVNKTTYIPVTEKLNDWEMDLEVEDLEHLADNPQKMAYIENLLKGEEEYVCILEDEK